jgi:hypothetical protein
MLLTSLAGVLLAAHAVLALGEVLFKNDPVTFATKNGPALNATVLILAFFGVIIQHAIAKSDAARERSAKAEVKVVKKKRVVEDDDEDDDEILPWWRRVAGRAA